MDLGKAMFTINKKSKELRDLIALLSSIENDDFKRKNIIIFMRLLHISEPEEVLKRLLHYLQEQKRFLYSLKFTVVRRDGIVQKSTKKEIQKLGKHYYELYLLYRYRGVPCHIPASLEDVTSAGFDLSEVKSESAGCVSALSYPISDRELKEAINLIEKEIGDTPLKSPPANIISKEDYTACVLAKQDISDKQERFEEKTSVFTLAEARRLYAEGKISVTTRRE